MQDFGVQPRAAEDPVESAYRLHSRAVLASLVRLLGGFDLAEEGLHEAFLAAATQWPRDGVPRDPRSWLISAGRFRVIDRLRSKARLDAVRSDLSQHLDMDTGPTDPPMGRQLSRRSFAAHLHLLPPGASRRRTSGDGATRSLRPNDRADCRRLSCQRADDRATDRSSEGANPRP